MSCPMLRSWLALSVLVLSAGCGGSASDENPRVMVMLVVDQLSPETLLRYDPHFSGGLRRLLDQGFHFRNAAHNHGVTETAPGHATISTGVLPSTHGVVANDWYEFDDAGEITYVYAVADSLSPIVGLPGRSGRSPRNLRRGGLADWVLAADSGAHVVSVSKKDRAGPRLLVGCRRGPFRDVGLVSADDARMGGGIQPRGASALPLRHGVAQHNPRRTRAGGAPRRRGPL